MADPNYDFQIDGQLESVVYLGKWDGDPLSSIIYLGFMLGKERTIDGKQIVMGFTDRILSMWSKDPGQKITEDELLAFCLQVIPSLLISGDKTDGHLKVVFHRDDDVSKKDGVNYIKAEESLQETARKILFSQSVPTNSLIRRKILEVCYLQWQSDPHGYIHINELTKRIPVNDIELERNLKYLSDGGFLDGKLTTGGYALVRITNHGIDIFEDPNEFNRLFSINVEQQTVNVGGDFIAPIIVGAKNKVFIKSDVQNAFNEIEIEIEKSEIPDKKAAKEAVAELRKELENDKPNPNRVREIMSKIGKAGDWLNQKILSHPLISQIIASVFVKYSVG